MCKSKRYETNSVNVTLLNKKLLENKNGSS